MPGKQLIDQLVRDLLRGHDPPLRIMHTQNPGRSLVSRPPQGQGERPSPAVMAATRSDSHALGPRHDSPANPHDRVYEPYAARRTRAPRRARRAPRVNIGRSEQSRKGRICVGVLSVNGRIIFALNGPPAPVTPTTSSRGMPGSRSQIRCSAAAESRLLSVRASLAESWDLAALRASGENGSGVS